MAADSADPRRASIHGKFQRVEENPGAEIGYRTVALFRMLDDDEKAYLQERHCIQRGPQGDYFAVTYPFYNNLLLERDA